MSHLAIGHLYTALHAACASAVARVVEANGVDVSYVDLGVDEREEALARHDIDILVSAWTPQDDALVHEGREVIGDLYQPQLALSVLKDAKDSVYTSFIVTEESCSYVKAVQEQHQTLKDLAVETIGEGDLLDRVHQAHEHGENPVFAVWQPHAAFHDGSLVELPDSNLLQGKSVSAQIILRDGLRDEVDEDLLDEMSIMMLGTRVMNALDYAVSVQGKDPEEAAEAWQRGRLLPR